MVCFSPTVRRGRPEVAEGLAADVDPPVAAVVHPGDLGEACEVEEVRDAASVHHVLLGLGRPARRGSRRRPCRAASAASCAAWSTAGRRRRCRAGGRSRAAGSGQQAVAAEGDRLAVEAGAGRPWRGRAGRRSTNAPGSDRQPSSSVVELALLALGQRRAPGCRRRRRCARRRRRGSRRRTPPGRRRSGRRPGRRRRRRTSWRPCRRPGARSSSSYDVTGLLLAVHHRVAPAGHRADGAALRERAVRCVDGSLGHAEES